MYFSNQIVSYMGLKFYLNDICNSQSRDLTKLCNKIVQLRKISNL